MKPNAMWYATAGGTQTGPMTFQQLELLVANGRITSTDFVWTDGMPEWQQASAVEGLFSSPTTVQSPPPLPRRPATLKGVHAAERSAVSADVATKRLEIPINRKLLLRNTNYTIALFSTLSLISFVGGVLFNGLWSVNGFGAVLFIVITIGCVAYRKQIRSTKYCIVNEVLEISTPQNKVRIPLSTITDVTVSQAQGLNNIVVRAGGVHILRGVSSPEPAAQALLSKRR
jgi:hypothetical protein